MYTIVNTGVGVTTAEQENKARHNSDTKRRCVVPGAAGSKEAPAGIVGQKSYYGYSYSYFFILVLHGMLYIYI